MFLTSPPHLPWWSLLIYLTRYLRPLSPFSTSPVSIVSNYFTQYHLSFCLSVCSLPHFPPWFLSTSLLPLPLSCLCVCLSVYSGSELPDTGRVYGSERWQIPTKRPSWLHPQASHPERRYLTSPSLSSTLPHTLSSFLSEDFCMKSSLFFTEMSRFDFHDRAMPGLHPKLYTITVCQPFIQHIPVSLHSLPLSYSHTLSYSPFLPSLPSLPLPHLFLLTHFSPSLPPPPPPSPSLPLPPILSLFLSLLPSLPLSSGNQWTGSAQATRRQ